MKVCLFTFVHMKSGIALQDRGERVYFRASPTSLQIMEGASPSTNTFKVSLGVKTSHSGWKVRIEITGLASSILGL